MESKAGEKKYTKDGRKVVVLGALNNSEYIVQEIFISGGTEIPGGENFTAKGLLDFPCISWKEKKLKEVEEIYEKETNRTSKLIDQERRTQREYKSLISRKFRDLNLSVEVFSLLDKYISGEITHYVSFRYSEVEIVDFKDARCECDHDNLKLLTLFGNSDGNLNWRLSRYSDNSGSSDEVIPCTSYEEAYKLGEEWFLNYLTEKNAYYNTALKMAEKYGFPFEGKAKDLLIDKMVSGNKKRIEQLEADIIKEKDIISKLTGGEE